MYAIVDISGKQFRAEPGLQLEVPHQAVQKGQPINFADVLLYDDGETVLVGTPTIADAQVTATVIRHGRGKKVVVFKKKRRKGYRVKNTHRQEFSVIKINEISVPQSQKKKKPVEEKVEE